jgi:hypothetical protein
VYNFEKKSKIVELKLNASKQFRNVEYINNKEERAQRRLDFENSWKSENEKLKKCKILQNSKEVIRLEVKFEKFPKSKALKIVTMSRVVEIKKKLMSE